MATQRTGVTATEVTGGSHPPYGVFSPAVASAQYKGKSIAIPGMALAFIAARQAACQTAVSVPVLGKVWLASAYMA